MRQILVEGAQFVIVHLAEEHANESSSRHDGQHVTSKGRTCRGDHYRSIAVLGSALPLNVHHRTGHAAESKSVHDLSLAGRSA